MGKRHHNAFVSVPSGYPYPLHLVKWQPGQTIVITTTELKDARDWHRNEERIIAEVKLTTLGANVCAVRVTEPLSYLHYGGREYQAEVALLSHNIVIQGEAINSPATDNQNVSCVVKTDSESTFPCEQSFLTGFGALIQIYTNAARSLLWSGDVSSRTNRRPWSLSYSLSHDEKYHSVKLQTSLCTRFFCA